ncbi:chorismate-binding protein [endosymbiont 'TC1' of Trimyema compressum]|uniref:chorismate-binding protein n=1 Tax=endosymbiont 'TC1' of Trimyema compressum TaxID=243899 RepID=UPI000B4D9A9D
MIDFDIKSDFNKRDYKKQIERIRDYIYKGDVYQVNMSRQLSGRTSLTTGELYLRLRETNKAPFCAYIPVRNGFILSSSPRAVYGGAKRTFKNSPN